jgi:hypothetical protein
MLETRQQMIDSTSAFLSWALRRHRRKLTYIPRRRVDQGGFSPLMREPGVRLRVDHWWKQVLDDWWPADDPVRSSPTNDRIDITPR